MADMSVATGQEMTGSALLLGKALNDPIAGLSALTRVGITFTDAQEDQIKALAESGDVMGAQKIILGELEKQFGGSAAALGDTMTGSINKMKNSFEELARNLATAIVPLMEALVGWLQKALSWFNNLSPGMKTVVRNLVLVAAAIGPMLIVGAKLVKAFQAIKTAFIAVQLVMAANPFILLAIAVAAIAFLIFKNWDKILAFLKAVWEKIKDVFDAAIDFLVAAITAYLGIYKAIWDKIVAVVRAAIDLIRRIWEKVVGIITGVLDRVKGVIGSIGGAIKRRIQEVIDGWKLIFATAATFIRDKWDALIEFFRGLPGRLASAASGLFDGIKDAFRAAVNFVIRAWNNLSLRLGGAKISLGFGRSFTIPSVTLRTPNIPTIHTGGTFHAPRPGGEGLAVLRDNERVLAAGSSQPIHVQLVVDSRVLAEALIRHEEALA